MRRSSKISLREIQYSLKISKSWKTRNYQGTLPDWRILRGHDDQNQHIILDFINITETTGKIWMASMDKMVIFDQFSDFDRCTGIMRNMPLFSQICIKVLKVNGHHACCLLSNSTEEENENDREMLTIVEP